MHSKSWLLPYLLCLSTALLLLGCGSAPTTGEPSPTTAAAAAASPTIAATVASSPTPAATALASPTVGPQGEGTPDTGEVATLCEANEEIMLSCQIAGSDKVLSVCASPDLAQDGYLQYRFGESGSVELAYPETVATSPQEAFLYTRSTGSGVDYIYLSFEVEEHIFRVYQVDNQGDRGAGVDVRDPEGQWTDFPCDTNRIEQLRVLEQVVPEGLAGEEVSEAPDSEMATVIVTFGEEPSSEMPAVYLHEVDTGAFYKGNMPIGPGLNQITFEGVKPGRYQIYAHSTVFEDLGYWGFWKSEGGLEVLTVEAGQEYSQPTLSAPADACAPAYQLPATPDEIYPATDSEGMAQYRGCP
jgi:hypothetical protein